MKRTLFILGGARSGKSSFALSTAEGMGAPRTYIATAQALDEEMDERIGLHRSGRGDGWMTIEEPRDVEARIAGIKGGVALLDCVTLWVTNLMAAGLGDDEIIKRASELGRACASSGASVVVVSNEVGLGIVPDNALARRFRDISGAVNRTLAAASDEVYFVAAGMPLRMK